MGDKRIKAKILIISVTLVTIIALFTTLLVSGVFAADTPSVSNVTRDMPATVVECSSMNVTLNVDVSDPDTFYILDEMYPDGWNVTLPGTGNTQHTGHIKWAVISGAADTQYEYTITAPCTVGTYNFTGVYGFDDMVIKPVLGQEEVTVIPLCTTTADTNASGTIELSEITVYVGSWFKGEVSRENLLQALVYFKDGSGC